MRVFGISDGESEKSGDPVLWKRGKQERVFTKSAKSSILRGLLTQDFSVGVSFGERPNTEKTSFKNVEIQGRLDEFNRKPHRRFRAIGSWQDHHRAPGSERT